MIKTAIIGASGFIGSRLLRSYRREFPDCIGTSFSNTQQDLVSFDVRDPDVSKFRLKENGYKAAIITSAKHQIAYCENETESALEVNVTGMKKLIKQLNEESMQIIFLSTDYVFDGSKGSYDDLDPTEPTTEYGKQKVMMEKEISQLTDNFIVIRLSKVFDLNKGDGTILDDLACKIVNNEEVLAAYDQLFCPTYVEDIVNAVHHIQSHNANGFINLCGEENYSRHQLANDLAKELGCSSDMIKKINLYDIPSMVGRPLDTTMKCSKLRKDLGFKFGSMKDYIRQVAQNYSQPQKVTC